MPPVACRRAGADYPRTRAVSGQLWRPPSVDPGDPLRRRAEVEMDLYGGCKGEIHDDVDVGLLRYHLPEGWQLRQPPTPTELYGAGTWGRDRPSTTHAVTNLSAALLSKNSGYQRRRIRHVSAMATVVNLPIGARKVGAKPATTAPWFVASPTIPDAVQGLHRGRLGDGPPWSAPTPTSNLYVHPRARIPATASAWFRPPRPSERVRTVKGSHHETHHRHHQTVQARRSA